MTSHDDSAAQEIARDAARVLPLVGCPRWALWLGTLLAVVLYVVGRRLLPSLGAAIAEAVKNAKPQTVADENGPQPEGEPLPTDPNRNFDEGGEG